MTLALTLGAVNGDTVDGCAVCDVKTVGKLDGAAVAAADGFSVRGERAGSGTVGECTAIVDDHSIDPALVIGRCCGAPVFVAANHGADGVAVGGAGGACILSGDGNTGAPVRAIGHGFILESGRQIRTVDGDAAAIDSGITIFKIAVRHR